jgi:hypothetical protein
MPCPRKSVINILIYARNFRKTNRKRIKSMDQRLEELEGKVTSMTQRSPKL